MSWFSRFANSDILRIKDNIDRLLSLKKTVHGLGYLVMASPTNGYMKLTELLKDPLVRGREKVYAKLSEALHGDLNQKIALDAPTKFKEIMVVAEKLIDSEIGKEKKKLLDT